ncbi:hypothetical protein AJ80_09391 [Polytolypa hystricis UAMH7299]|uniref:Uncharacterized protein n=1 Tax=Polytolypa hystricis (strain UAMH7299) TaxID=1447883 RepID=A0A2B7WS35_POLH7|nr:hypothetical protein AJ80_09391 [Polytolypa hystricis UAMH7299]
MRLSQASWSSIPTPSRRALHTRKPTPTIYWRERAIRKPATSLRRSTSPTNSQIKDVLEEQAPKSLQESLRFDSRRMELERANLLEQFGLSRIPQPESPGVEISRYGRLRITSEKDSRQKHKTALVLSRSPLSLEERDFVRILGPGKHLEGWRGRGGLEQIVPMRDDDLRRRNIWILVFATPASAKEYQDRALHLKLLARDNTPMSPISSIAPPPNYTIGGLHGDRLSDFTLTTPWLRLSLHARLAPFHPSIQRAIDLHNQLAVSGRDNKGFPVRFWIEEHNLVPITAARLRGLLSWDSNARGSPWQILEGMDSITPLADGLQYKMFDQKKKQGPQAAGSDNWCIMFQTASEAKRFVRVWHRRRLPMFESLPFSDPQPMINAECLFPDITF